jgi:thiamine-phosphate pyrophosphorylase
LISTVFATQSHPAAKPLGVVRLAKLAGLARKLGLAVYALGGIDAKNEKRLRSISFDGVAGIGFMRDQA